MIHIEEKHYRALAAPIAESIAESGFFKRNYELEFPEFRLEVEISVMMYASRVIGGEGKGWWKLDKIIPVWWEARTITEDGEKLNDFSFSEFEEYIFQAL